MSHTPGKLLVTDEELIARVRECYEADQTLAAGGVTAETLADELEIAASTAADRCKRLADRGDLERDWGFDDGQQRLGYRPARDRTVALRDGETRDGGSHAGVLEAQFAEADPETRAKLEADQ